MLWFGGHTQGWGRGLQTVAQAPHLRNVRPTFDPPSYFWYRSCSEKLCLWARAVR